MRLVMATLFGVLTLFCIGVSEAFLAASCAGIAGYLLKGFFIKPDLTVRL